MILWESDKNMKVIMYTRTEGMGVTYRLKMLKVLSCVLRCPEEDMSLAASSFKWLVNRSQGTVNVEWNHLPQV